MAVQALIGLILTIILVAGVAGSEHALMAVFFFLLGFTVRKFLDTYWPVEPMEEPPALRLEAELVPKPSQSGSAKSAATPSGWPSSRPVAGV